MTVAHFKLTGERKHEKIFIPELNATPLEKKYVCTVFINFIQCNFCGVFYKEDLFFLFFFSSPSPLFWGGKLLQSFEYILYMQ